MARRISPDERARRLAALAEGRAAGEDNGVIAARLGMRRNTFVEWVFRMERVAAPPPSRSTITRNCLRCTRPFESEGAHNRMCNYCRGYAPLMDTQFVPDPGGSTGRQVKTVRA
jgi:hypothetical protein